MSNDITGIIDNKMADAYGEFTYFRIIASKFVEKVVKEGNWFGFCCGSKSNQVDIMSIKNNEGIKLGSIVREEISLGDQYRTSLFRYLLANYLCYCEIPTVIRNSDVGYKDSYTKCLVTSDIGVIANWMGMSYDDVEDKYGLKLIAPFKDTNYMSETEMFPYVKLVEKNGERKVSKPRKDLDLSTPGIKIVPLFALKAGVDTLCEMCKEDFYKVTFLKDSGQVREITMCLNYDKISEIYKDKGKLNDCFTEQYDGDFINKPGLARGYIRVIEVGTSIDSRPVRSINFARIQKVEKVKPDLTFINVNLDTVKSTFIAKLRNKNVNYKVLVDMLDVFKVGTTRKYNGSRISSLFELENWVEQQEMLLSTPFIKQLALFMMDNPIWFDDYDGTKPEEINQNAVEENFDDLDLGF